MLSEVALGLVFTLPGTHCSSYLLLESKSPKTQWIKTNDLWFFQVSGLADHFCWCGLSQSCYCSQLKGQLGLRCPRWPHYMSGPWWGLCTAAPGPPHPHVSFHSGFFAASWSSTGCQGSKKASPNIWGLINLCLCPVGQSKSHGQTQSKYERRLY